MNRQFRRKQEKTNKGNMTTRVKQSDELAYLNNQVHQIQQQYINSYTNMFTSMVLNVAAASLRDGNLLPTPELIKTAMEISEAARIEADGYAQKLHREAKIPVSLLNRIRDLEGEQEPVEQKPDLKILPN